MSYDLIIVSQSKDSLIQLTENCIASARQDDANLKIIVVETGNPYKYDADKIVEYNGEFNYNRALNLGLKYATGDVHVLANNDIIFHKGWSQIGEYMKLYEYHSASARHSGSKYPASNFLYEGYEIGIELTGWCIFMDRYCHETIGPLDETMSFWYSDNLYALQLQRAGISHAMFCNIQVDHIVSRTLSMQPSRVQRKYQMGELSKYINRKKQYAQRERV